MLANGTPASTTPSPFLMGADPSASQSFALTLAGGPQALTVTAQDACGNQSPDQDAITVTLDVDGCPSRFAGFANNPQILNAAAGQVVGGSLEVDIAAQVDNFNAGCVGGTAQLLVDDSVVQSISVPGDGSLSFTGIGLAPGSRNLRLRVSAAGLDTVDSQVQVVTVDIDTPSISFVSPTDNSAILSDADSASDNGQQVTIIGTVTEPSVATSRTVTLSIDGSLVDSTVVGNGASEQVNFVDQTLTSGLHTLELCVADEASAAVCETIQVNADPAAPGALTNVEANVRNTRSSSVELSFVAPGDDGAIGVVAGYEIRRVVKADPNAAVTVAEWDAASASSLIVNDTTASGGGVTIDITGVGPGSTNAAHGPLADGLVPNQSHTLAIAAIDDATDLDAGASHPRLGAISDITVDLTWRTETYDIPRSDGDWAGGGLSGQASPITRAGDVDNSGQDDVVVTYWTFQGGFQTAAHLILGNNDTANAVSAPLVFPAESFVASAGGQDGIRCISDIVL